MLNHYEQFSGITPMSVLDNIRTPLFSVKLAQNYLPSSKKFYHFYSIVCFYTFESGFSPFAYSLILISSYESQIARN